ncbi:MAG: hypothetical protein AAB343_00130 [Patescibacteria group bacterium]
MKPRITFRKSLFWDVNIKDINTKRHAEYIIERVADFGNDKEARWVLNHYDSAAIRKVIDRSRTIRPRTKALWSLLVKIK